MQIADYLRKVILYVPTKQYLNKFHVVQMSDKQRGKMGHYVLGGESMDCSRGGTSSKGLSSDESEVIWGK